MRGTFLCRGGAILHLPKLAIPATISFRGAEWRAKSEFHVTLLASDALLTLGEAAVRGAARGVRFEIGLREEWWVVADGDLRTIIHMADLQSGADFFERLAVVPPPFHVTLYTIGTAKGIAIPTRLDLERMGVPMEGAEREAFQRLLDSWLSR